MTVYDVYANNYKEYCYVDPENTKYGWVANHIFNLATYDDSLDELFAKKIIEVCKAILDGTTYDYIRDGSNYISYILVCQLLYHMNWIDWGTSIRGAWFDDYGGPHTKPTPILTYYDCHEVGFQEIRFTKDNLKTLIDFIEEENKDVTTE